jgi:hypothetical protein
VILLVDTSVVLKWLHEEGETEVEAAPPVPSAARS